MGGEGGVGMVSPGAVGGVGSADGAVGGSGGAASDKPVVEAILGWRYPLTEKEKEAERCAHAHVFVCVYACVCVCARVLMPMSALAVGTAWSNTDLLCCALAWLALEWWRRCSVLTRFMTMSLAVLDCLFCFILEVKGQANLLLSLI
eukprot:scaffold122758_cov21-Tisochrysis_lutea.AAC.1